MWTANGFKLDLLCCNEGKVHTLLLELHRCSGCVLVAVYFSRGISICYGDLL